MALTLQLASPLARAWKLSSSAYVSQLVIWTVSRFPSPRLLPICSRLRRTTEQVQDVTFLNMPTRLAKTLLRLTAERPGSAPKVAITQREISQIIGRSRESTNKQLRSWAKHGLIRLQRRAVVILRPDKLAEVAAQGSWVDPRELPEAPDRAHAGDMKRRREGNLFPALK